MSGQKVTGVSEVGWEEILTRKVINPLFAGTLP